MGVLLRQLCILFTFACHICMALASEALTPRGRRVAADEQRRIEFLSREISDVIQKADSEVRLLSQVATVRALPSAPYTLKAMIPVKLIPELIELN
jgi:hypothetical protein